LKCAIASAGFALSFAAAPNVAASEGWDSGMIAMLPPYCKHSAIYRQRLNINDPGQLEYWRQVIGPGFAHIHHYCNGLRQTNMALLRTRDKRERLSLLSTSINEFDYVIRNVQENFVLLPEILSKKGENLIRLGRGPESIQVMEQAMRIKPDYWPPYAHLSDYYMDIGQHEKAKQVLEKGLSQSPGAEALSTRLQKISR
jgi:tetratricopeptide (TPR) repeat protein